MERNFQNRLLAVLGKQTFDAMAQKTILKDILSKYGPLSVEMQKAIEEDNQDSTISTPKDITPQEQIALTT
ncbi:RecT protein [Streptococcus pyogenes]|nr:RecT protein [Streptococcus pyogenes]